MNTKLRHSITPLLFAFAAFSCDPLFAQTAARPIDEAFKRLDKNGDGKISREEAPSAESFAAADADKDGVVTLEEFRRYMAARQGGKAATKGSAPATIPAPEKAGEPPLKQLPDSDAVRDAAGRGQLFECIHVAGLTELQEGLNGFAIADLNGDGRPDIVGTFTPPVAIAGRARTRDKLRVLINEGGFRFRPHTIAIRGSALTADDFGVSSQIPNLVDFNGDGLLDILVTRSAAATGGKVREGVVSLGNTLLLSDGAWDKFSDVSDAMGLRNELAYNRQTSIGDVNGDGFLDIAIGCDNIKNALGGVPHSRLYVFQPRGAKFEDGKFEDIGGGSLVPDFGGFYHDAARDKAGPGITLRDLDGDGDLDLVQSYHTDVQDVLAPYSPGEYRQGVLCWKNLLRESGQLRFEKITGNGLACEARLKWNAEKQLYEPASDARAPGLPYLAVADVDHDGRPDIFVTGPNSDYWAPRVEDVSGRFWKNLGGFQFAEQTQPAGLDAINNTYRQWNTFFDAPTPARLANWRPSPQAVGCQPGKPPVNPLDRRPYYADAIFADYDNNGWLDLVVLDRAENDATRAMLWLGRGDGTFEPQPTTFSGLDGSGIAGEAADLNGDGLLDLIFAADPDNSGTATDLSRYESKVYWNTGEHGARANHWLHLRFTGVKDADLIGARVELTADGHKQTHWIHSNHSYKTGGILDAHFGLGLSTSAAIKVTLPSGRTQTFANLASDKTHTLTLGKP